MVEPVFFALSVLERQCQTAARNSSGFVLDIFLESYMVLSINWYF